jgi:hypothetical protein
LNEVTETINITGSGAQFQLAILEGSRPVAAVRRLAQLLEVVGSSCLGTTKDFTEDTREFLVFYTYLGVL